MEAVSDAELIVRLQAGSLDELGVLYDRHRNLVYRTALAITGDVEAAGDLLQDVFLRLYRFADRVDVKRPLEPWLYRMTTNLSYTWVKKRRRWFYSLEEVTEWISGMHRESLINEVELNETKNAVQKAVLALPVSHRVVVVLYYVNDLSLQEISEILDIPVGTVKSRLHYGRQTLKKHLGLQTGEPLPELLYEFT